MKIGRVVMHRCAVACVLGAVLLIACDGARGARMREDDASSRIETQGLRVD